ncbi:cytochrome P450 [Mesorhizobium sp. ArgA1]
MVQRDGSPDLMREFADPLPTNVIAELFGLPDEQREEIVALTYSLANTSATAAEARQTRQRIPEFFRRLIALKRGHLGDDLASALIVARDNGELVSDTELIDMLFMVLSAGFVTTTGVIGNGVLALPTHPQQLHLARSGKVPWSQAIEEILRWGSAVANLPFRYAAQDLEIDGCMVRRSDAVLMAFHAANRDEKAFGLGADRFDVTRRHNPHLSFGEGPRLCMGAALARLEMRCAFPALFGRLEDLALAIAAEATCRLTSFGARSACRSPLPFHRLESAALTTHSVMSGRRGGWSRTRGRACPVIRPKRGAGRNGCSRHSSSDCQGIWRWPAFATARAPIASSRTSTRPPIMSASPGRPRSPTAPSSPPTRTSWLRSCASRRSASSVATTPPSSAP